MRLTSEQRQRVHDNHGLIWDFINKNKLNEDEGEWYGLIAESLCKAVVNHDSTKGALSTLFFRIARNDMINNNKRLDIISDRELFGISDTIEEEMKLGEIDYNYEDISIDGFSDRMYDIANLLIVGSTQGDISNLLNLNQSTISREISKMRDIIMEDDKYEYLKDV